VHPLLIEGFLKQQQHKEHGKRHHSFGDLNVTKEKKKIIIKKKSLINSK
jgi:hypothetical protein